MCLVAVKEQSDTCVFKQDCYTEYPTNLTFETVFKSHLHILSYPVFGANFPWTICHSYLA